ncbi:TPA: hypothetical protein I7108_000106 [Vibrio cholerae O1]|uniref:hypothetical protein n=1 Tax=Vibrio cholerae TaxID=666 RepID=UPI0003481F49|nr:hypothetical protein [Vibrio cholerae]HAS2376656.1 hypothetical protein [Vibrio cholerae O1]EGR1036654.1 hypothetical protein [Vibrio cholerae]EGR2426975.1 hypothetical protein [Vibrio cholerae]EJL6290806.1 hypothetical protein [Vibrio cholerae]ELJ8564231.1 hypothetical protein [Vibrio cholerae]
METVAIEQFVPTLRQLVNVALAPLLHSALLQAGQEFCRESGLVRYERKLEGVKAENVIAVVGSSDLNEPGKGSYLTSEVMAVLDDEGTALIKGVNYRQMNRDVLMFLTDCQRVSVHCSVEPQLHSKTLPKVLFDEYCQAVCYGAAHILMLQPDSDWHNPKLGNEYRAWFMDALRKAKRFSLESGEVQSFSNPIRQREFF